MRAFLALVLAFPLAAARQAPRSLPRASGAGPHAAPERSVSEDRQVYDGAAEAPAGSIALPVAAAVAGAAAGPLGVPVAYALARYPQDSAEAERLPPPVERYTRISEHADAHVAGFSTLILAYLASLTPMPEMLFAAVLGGGATLTALAMEQQISHLRRTRVEDEGFRDGSHDAVYRTDITTGKLRDIRSVGYEKDHWHVWKPGPVTAGERLYFRVVSLGVGLPWLTAAASPKLWVYGAAVAAGYAATDLLRRRARRKKTTKS